MSNTNPGKTNEQQTAIDRIDVLRQIDDICLRYERGLRAGVFSDIRPLLEPFTGTARSDLFRELLLLEWDYRREASAAELLREYLEKFPDDHETVRQVYARQTANDGRSANYVGLSFGDYELLSPLGQGGMATVYLARHRPMRRNVAVKVIHGDHSRAIPFVRRFRREIETTARLSHPHIVTAFDAGEHEGVPYLVTEYVSGIDLSQLVKRDGRLPWQTAVRYVMQAADALRYAHEHGIIHRDVKPSNLLVDNQGLIKLLDLGLARFLGEDDNGEAENFSQLTEHGTIVGTVDFMAPEQARSPSLADHRADIYGLGCTLHYLVTGKPMFSGETRFARMLAHREETPPRLTATIPDVPRELDALFLTMVAKEPDARPANMRELIDHFAAICDGRVINGPTSVGAWLRSRLPAIASLTVSAVTIIALRVVGPHVGFGTPVRSQVHPTVVSRPPATVRPNYPLATVDAPCEVSRVAEIQAELAKQIDMPIVWHNEVGIKFQLIPGGTFVMGQAPEKYRAGWVELVSDRNGGFVNYPAPPHLVRITRPFYLATTETTVAQFRLFVSEASPTLDSDRSGAWGEENGRWVLRRWYSWSNLGERPVADDHPVSNISWNDALKYCEWLTSRSDGRERYRLPTEAEWEFACRAGTTTHWSFGDNIGELAEYGWCRTNAEGGLHPVATRRPNPFGLFDMHGSKQEWCADWFGQVNRSEATDPVGPAAGQHKVRRGGGVLTHVMASASAARGFSPPNDPAGGGFRIVCEIDLKSKP